MLCNNASSTWQSGSPFYSSRIDFTIYNSQTFHKARIPPVHGCAFLPRHGIAAEAAGHAISVRKRVLFVVRVFEGSDVLLETTRGFLPLVELAEMVVCHCLQIVCLCCHLTVLHVTRDLAYLMPEVFMQAAQDVRFYVTTCVTERGKDTGRINQLTSKTCRFWVAWFKGSKTASGFSKTARIRG